MIHASILGLVAQKSLRITQKNLAVSYFCSLDIWITYMTMLLRSLPTYQLHVLSSPPPTVQEKFNPRLMLFLYTTGTAVTIGLLPWIPNFIGMVIIRVFNGFAIGGQDTGTVKPAYNGHTINCSFHISLSNAFFCDNILLLLIT